MYCIKYSIWLLFVSSTAYKLLLLIHLSLVSCVCAKLPRFLGSFISGTVAVPQITRTLFAVSNVVLITFQNGEIYLAFVWDSVDDKRTDRFFFSLLISFILAFGTNKNTPPKHIHLCTYTTTSPWLEYIVKFRSKQESGHKYPPERNNKRVTFCLYLRGRYGWTKKRIYGLFAIFGFSRLLFRSVFALMCIVFGVFASLCGHCGDGNGITIVERKETI